MNNKMNSNWTFKKYLVDIFVVLVAVKYLAIFKLEYGIYMLTCFLLGVATPFATYAIGAACDRLEAYLDAKGSSK